MRLCCYKFYSTTLRLINDCPAFTRSNGMDRRWELDKTLNNSMQKVQVFNTLEALVLHSFVEVA